MKQHRLSIAALAATLALGAVPLGAGAADTKARKIALSNNFAGNSWRQAMLKSWDKVGKNAVAQGLLAQAPSFTTSENQATEQAAQIQNLILQGFDAIVINAASPTALNGAVKQACDAGIVVVSFDGIVNEPCAWRIAVDFKQLGQMQIDYFASRGLKGNLLEVRGIAGVFVDDEIHQGVTAAVAKRPEYRIVGSVHGNWTQTVAQKEVSAILSTLPQVAAVATQGGDGYGVAQAFKAAGRAMPVIFMGNRHDELAWWKEQRDAHQYQTMSASIAPGASTFAFWVAQQILAGAKVPKEMKLPISVVTQEQLDEALKKTEPGSVVNVEYTQQQVIDFIAKTR
ncbi:ABC transporter substrate-binding protein [Verminephrobacter eiseniae]|uniref:Putative simple sugar transport system substrate-binding protein n=1 Tax=Verminephrobacter eiseniae (strain EF01-2) TaxID=391735 RepID=A1WI38_VEREI|nr:ABC transporter substrate-binding protein [Verminephrobacter eiseniae]ABM57295.1 putative simple sugar transport system substrate-binding protein [Verminephrobacter eiseniae EF01-2]MCW5282922.1 ABC transporter substrate-binding protein [Verminephrobacter eiseniae]MCW5303237.1 ABC transporter substrate-binding protein [Verminephrobacter eiseniae]MCW8180390.1 ABC transporter substrate-binding protein [Verminephrobacter eiseniae]MCW8188630.1 ABC transporter substrate-binding protein [Vermineph